MPSKTPAMANFMAMCAHNPQHANGKCPSPEVAKEFNQADKGTGMIQHNPKSRNKNRFRKRTNP